MAKSDARSVAIAKNARKVGPDWPPVVVGGVFQTGLNLMRDLIRKGVKAFGIDSDLQHEGFRSRYGKSYPCPDPDLQPAEWVAFMQSLARDLKNKYGVKPVFICAADQWVTALGAHQEALRDHYTFSPGATIQSALTNKDEQYALADKYDFPRPLTAEIRCTADVDAFIERAMFPCLLKPLSAREWDNLPEGSPMRGLKIATAETPGQLIALYSGLEPYRPNVIAQELIQGPNTNMFCYFSVYATGGSLLSSGCVQEIRNHPKRYGAPSIIHPVSEPEILSLCDRFLRAVGYVGICEIEVKRDSRDGIFKLIEVNPRVTGSGDAASYMGVETGWLHYLDLIGQKPEPVPASRLDFYHIGLKWDFMISPACLQAGILTWHDALVPYRTEREFFDLDLHDWRLAVETLYKCGRYAAGAAWRSLRAK
jgi:predicted ATP-grasp superfamily ATP-dependent carboligase